MAVKKSRKFSGFAIYYYCKDSAFRQLKVMRSSKTMFVGLVLFVNGRYTNRGNFIFC